MNRDNILIQTYRNRHANKDDTVSIEQGPINLSPKAMNERGFWVYNEEPQTVYRGIKITPQQVLKEGGMHTQALSTEGIVYHVNVNSTSGTRLTGGAISTSVSHDVALSFAQGQSVGYLYKIDLEPQQGVDVSKTCQALIDSGTITDEEELLYLQSAIVISDDEEEISVLCSISPSQISVKDYRTNTFIPINEWVESNKNV